MIRGVSASIDTLDQVHKHGSNVPFISNITVLRSKVTINRHIGHFQKHKQKEITKAKQCLEKEEGFTE